jgi:hypothetical protein
MTAISLEYTESPRGVSLMEHVRAIPFIRERLARREARRTLTPPCQYTTIEELRAGVLEGWEDYLAGRYLTHEEVGEHLRQLMK